MFCACKGQCDCHARRYAADGLATQLFQRRLSWMAGMRFASSSTMAPKKRSSRKRANVRPARPRASETRPRDSREEKREGPPPREATLMRSDREREGRSEEAIRQRTTSACREVLAESDAVSTDSLSCCQESAASLREDSTSVNFLKGRPAFTRPSR